MKPKTCCRAMALLLWCWACTSAIGQTPSPPTPEKWKPEDVVMAESASQFHISPDGKWVIWLKSTADKETDGRIAHVILSSLTEDREIQLTRGSANHSQPRWSPNGDRIAFLSSRPLPKPKEELSKMQLWLMNPFGGEPWHLTEFERGIRSYEWADKDTIIFSAEEDPSLYERQVKEKKDDSRVIDDVAHAPYVRLFKLAIPDKKVTRLTTNDDWIETWAVSKDGRRAAAVHAQYLSYEWDHKIPPRTFVHNLETGEAKEVLTGGKIRPYALRWARDGSGFYAAAPHTSHPVFYTATITLVYFCEVATGNTIPVNLDWANGLAADVEILDDGFVTLLAAGARFQPARYDRQGGGWTRVPIQGDHAANIIGIVLGEDGKTAVYGYSTASKPEQWYRATLEGGRLNSPVQLTKLNPQFKSRTFARTEVIRWKGALDEEVEGILYYPHEYQEGMRYPLVVAIHGGPAGADFDAFDESYAYPINLFAQRGAFVLRPNYHGSSNYGLPWVESICCGKYYELEVPDIEKGVDFLISQGWVDAARIGTMGWSNGSILSTQLLVTNPQRYKAASVGAGDVEWISDWANVDFGQSFDAYYFGKSVLEDPELYVRKSPVFKMDRLQTPTIIYHGTEDRNVPTDQSWTYYRALYHLGKVPVRFLLFPGEPHGLGKLSHQLRKVEEEMTWFDRYLFKAEKPANEAFKENSPLGIELKKKSYRGIDTAYGVSFKPGASGAATLIPEVVRRGELEIGRFEVTRAQYAAFDKNYPVVPGTGNYPANGISLENAKAYTAWLSQLTGQTYRIPAEEEVGSLHKPRQGENTLDHWAGYAVNPEDAERLAAKLKELRGPDALLREAGSFPPDGLDEEEWLFDLGGNVSEWVLSADGSGKQIGGNAGSPADSKALSQAVDLQYAGFRVVRGEAKKKDEVRK